VSGSGGGGAFPRTAFVLGAGLGTRLRPLTDTLPKPLLPVRGLPMICHIFDQLLAAGARRLIVNTHHLAGCYAKQFPDARWRGAPIHFVHEPVLLETGGGLKNIEPLLDAGDESVLVANGDVFAQPDLGALAAAHHAAGGDALATLLLRTDAEPRKARLDTATGAVLDMRGRLGATGGVECLFTGFYCVRRAFLAHIPPATALSVVETFLALIAARAGSVRGVLSNAGEWRDLGELGEYRKFAGA
jgi:NDP-sugar pyrophosphorylase family protein